VEIDSKTASIRFKIGPGFHFFLASPPSMRHYEH
jgi:hypothetical protein